MVFFIDRPATPRIDHCEGLCQVILEIDCYVVKDKLFAQRCQELLDGIPRITRLYGSLQKSLQVLERLVIHGFYFESPATSNGNLNVEPWPSVDWTSSIEPCASMICLTSESP